MYAVSVTILHTDIGIEQVGTYKITLNSQKVFENTLYHYLKSRTADIGSNELFTYISTGKFDDENWNRTAVGFFTNQKEQVRAYNEIFDTEYKLPPKICFDILKASVFDTEELSSVQNTAGQLKISKYKYPSYSEYYFL